MGKVKTRCHLETQDKKKDQGAVGKIVKKKTAILAQKKKAATLTQKKKETIVQDINSKKDELSDKIITLKKNKIISNFKEEKEKSNSKKNKNSVKLDLVPKAENIKSERVTRKTAKNVKSVPVSREEKHEHQVISKKNESKDKPAAGLKDKKIKSSVISKKNNAAIKKRVVLKEGKKKSKVVSEKNKKKFKKIPVPEEPEVITKVLSKKEKINLKKVLVPRDEKNLSEVVPKKNKQKSKKSAVSKEEKNDLKTVSKKVKRKAESISQKENTRPEVALKKAKVSADVAAKKKKGSVEPILEKESEDSQSLSTKKKVKIAKDFLKRKNVENAVKALLKVVDKGIQKRRALFTSENLAIFLNINCVKVPKTPLHQIRFALQHSFVDPGEDIALFVKDIKRGRRRSFDDTIHHFEDLLQKHGCNRIKSIIPINQVKTDYRQFEMRRRLLNSYDHFLCDGRISGHLAHLLGKEFREHRKLPTSIHMDRKDLKEEIDKALKKTSLQIHSNGDSYVTQFATCQMSVDEITDNLLLVIQELSKHFPGGWQNIRSLRIKSPLSLAIPLYMTLKNKNEVEVPVVEPKRPKAYKSVKGELSTFTSNVHVTVAPDGTVDVHKLGGESDEDEENFDEIEEEDNGENEKAENEVKEEDDEDEDEEKSDEEEEDEDDDNDEENESDA